MMSSRARSNIQIPCRAVELAIQYVIENSFQIFSSYTAEDDPITHALSVFLAADSIFSSQALAALQGLLHVFAKRRINSHRWNSRGFHATMCIANVMLLNDAFPRGIFSSLTRFSSLGCSVWGINSMKQLHTFDFFAMGGGGVLHLFEEPQRAEEVADAAIAEVKRIEAKYSRYRADSVLSHINEAASRGSRVELDEETGQLMDFAFSCFKMSGSRFDVSSGLLRQAWDFSSHKIPTSEEIGCLLPRIGLEKVRWERPTLSFSAPGMELDFGGIGKEYAVDRVADLCEARGAKSVLIDLGGDIRAVGPSPDGSPWPVHIRHPRRPQEVIKTFFIERGAVATSGDYERFMEIGGRRFCHILDPTTGWPVQGLSSVTVLSERCMTAGAISTIAMLKEIQGPSWLSGLGVSCHWIAQDGSSGGTI